MCWFVQVVSDVICMSFESIGGSQDRSEFWEDTKNMHYIIIYIHIYIYIIHVYIPIFICVYIYIYIYIICNRYIEACLGVGWAGVGTFCKRCVCATLVRNTEVAYHP